MKGTPLWEDVVLILAIFTLWPVIINKESFFSKTLLYAALVLCIVILVRRMKRWHK